jgi:putative DNA-invertase from lambdoid prophage Rac
MAKPEVQGHDRQDPHSETLIVTMLAAMAEMERDLLIERTQAGFARTKVQGKSLGRPNRTTDE